MAQLVEHHLAKVGVAGSNPVVRSKRAADLQFPFGVEILLNGVAPNFAPIASRNCFRPFGRGVTLGRHLRV